MFFLFLFLFFFLLSSLWVLANDLRALFLKSGFCKTQNWEWFSPKSWMGAHIWGWMCALWTHSTEQPADQHHWHKMLSLDWASTITNGIISLSLCWIPWVPHSPGRCVFFIFVFTRSYMLYSICQHHQGIKIQEDSNEDPWSCLSWVHSGLTPLSSRWSWKLWKASRLHQNQNPEKWLKTILNPSFVSIHKLDKLDISTCC